MQVLNGIIKIAVDLLTLGGSSLSAASPKAGVLAVSDVGITATEETLLGTLGTPYTLTTDYTGAVSAALDCADAHEIHFQIYLATGTPAQIDAEPQWSNDGSLWRYLPNIASVSLDGELTTTLESHIVERNGVGTLTAGQWFSLIYKRPKSATSFRLRLKTAAGGETVVVTGFAEI